VMPAPDDSMATGLYQPGRAEAAYAATVQLPPSQGSGTAAGPEAPRMAVVEGSGPSLSTETNLLRQVRLRAAVLYLSLWWCVILVQTFRTGLLWPLPPTVAIGLGAALALLSRRRPIPRPG
jgi:hypothetical protein